MCSRLRAWQRLLLGAKQRPTACVLKAFLLWAAPGAGRADGPSGGRRLWEPLVLSGPDEGRVGLAHSRQHRASALGPGWKFSLCVCREKAGLAAWEGSSDSGCAERLLLAGQEGALGLGPPEACVSAVSEVVGPGCGGEGGEGGAHGQGALIWVPRPALWAHAPCPRRALWAGLGGR